MAAMLRRFHKFVKEVKRMDSVRIVAGAVWGAAVGRSVVANCGFGAVKVAICDQ